MGRDLTFRQRRFVKEYVANNGNGTKAAQIAYNPSTVPIAAQMASELLTVPKVQRSIVAALEKAGVTEQKLAETHGKLIACADSADIAEKSIGLRATALAYKVRGDLQDQSQSNAFHMPPTTMNILLQVITELVPSEEPEQVLDVTPKDS